MKLEDYKKYPKVCCIYEIHNIITNKKYVGSCVDLHARMVRHMWYLCNSVHHSTKLQRSFLKHGVSNFDVNILLEFSERISDLDIFEEDFIRRYDSVENGYNNTYNTKIYHGGVKLTSAQIEKRIKHCQKEVVCINRFTGEVENVFDSLTKAGKYYKTPTTNISSVCNGKLNYIKDTIFRYSTDYKGEKLIYDTHHNKSVPKSDEIREKMMKSNPFSKIVKQYDLNMNFIKEYISRNQCIIQTQYGDYKIRQAIKNKTPLEGYYFIQDDKI